MTKVIDIRIKLTLTDNMRLDHVSEEVFNSLVSIITANPGITANWMRVNLESDSTTTPLK